MGVILVRYVQFNGFVALSPSFFLSLANGDSIQVQRDRRQILPSAVNHDQRLINTNLEEPLAGLGENPRAKKKQCSVPI